MKQKKIFLSHASKDKPLADKVADLLTHGCDVSPNEILCTSLEGKGIPAGTSSFIEFLRGQIQQPELVVFLLSQNFFASHFCLCELGAVWGMSLPFFPLIVPPAEKSQLKAVLAVAQAGNINDKAWLDELRDDVRKKLSVSVPTATWNVKRDAFLKGAAEIIKNLPQPATVELEKLQEAQAQYQAALAEVEAKEREIGQLKNQIAELEKCKDAAQVNAINRKYSTSDDEFDQLCKRAKKSLNRLKRATCIALFFEFRNRDYVPSGEDAWEDVKSAHSVQQIEVDEDNNVVTSNDDHPLVTEAKAALYALEKFLDGKQQIKFVESQTKEHKFPIALGNKDFWSEFLVEV